MSFYQELKSATESERQALIGTEMIQRTFSGDIELDDYVRFLGQAYHHVKHTVPLLMSVGARLGDDKEWLRSAVAEYIEEEIGHQEWILNDIAACGYDKEAVRNSTPNFETELMVSYAYDLVNRINPVGFFGMVLVLEGTSVNLADSAADRIKTALNLSERAFSYLRSHGSLDQEHIKFLETLMDKFEDPQEQQLIIHSAQAFYRLYRGVFESIRH
ncbi:MAG: iron-containing redox enzyme family protein [Gammaproteobacteria bacterium]|jgi:pyrroloquinoline quinone (PQQ) biosynthesis protein C